MTAYDFDIPVPRGKAMSADNDRRFKIANEMPVGASFLFENASRHQVCGILRRVRKAMPEKSFVSRTVIVKGVTSVRTWRINDGVDA